MLPGKDKVLSLLLNDNSRYNINPDVVNYDNSAVFDIPYNTLMNTTSSNYVVINSRYESRLDLVSYDYYGTSQYWWAIAQYNRIEDPFNVPYGTVVSIPDINSIIVNKGVV